ncbi:MAG: methionine ABC transporter permease [Clostridia bacterium]
MFEEGVINLIGKGILETFYMVLLSTFMAYAIGLPLGLLLVATDKDGVRPRPVLNKIIGVSVNALRSIPFAILMFAVNPLTRAIIGTTIGSSATVVPLVIGAAPFVARMVESSIKEVDTGVVEAAQSMGATPMQIVFKVLLPEAKPSLIVGTAIATITILGYSAMAGFTGGGGLGAIAVNYGYYRFEVDVMLVTVLLMVVIVQILQEIGMRIANRIDKRRRG